MKVRVISGPNLKSYNCAECGFVFPSILSDDRKFVIYTHYGGEYYAPCPNAGFAFKVAIHEEIVDVDSFASDSVTVIK